MAVRTSRLARITCHSSSHHTNVGEGDTFSHRFDLVVPALDGYTHSLFTIGHGAAIYPVWVKYDNRRLASEKEFVEWLGEKLFSPETKRTVANLLSQVAARRVYRL